MTLQSAFLLHKLRRAQLTEDGEVYLDLKEMTASTVHDVNAPCKTVKLRLFRKSINSILQYLESTGYIQQTGYDNFQVLHSGWHTTQSFLTKLCNFLVKSILTPIVVSIITTLLTAWVCGLLK